MDRDRLVPVVLALLAVVAIGLAAATLTNPQATAPGGGGGFGGGGPEGGVQSGQSGGSILPKNGSQGAGAAFGIPRPCIEFLTTGRFFLSLPAVLLVVGWLLARKLDYLSVVALGAGLLTPSLVVYLVLTAGCGPVSIERAASEFGLTGNEGGFLSGGDPGLGPSGQGTPTPSTLLLLAVVAVAIAVVVVLLFAETAEGDDRGPAAGETPTTPAPERLEAIGSAAGDAADRIEESATVDNEVYRAWAEMTRHVDVAHPESSTPGEFATAAVEAGMDRADVDELTGLFEEVRYGDRSVTSDHERRAVSALRRIERQYASGDGGASARVGGGDE